MFALEYIINVFQANVNFNMKRTISQANTNSEQSPKRIPLWVHGGYWFNLPTEFTHARRIERRDMLSEKGIAISFVHDSAALCCISATITQTSTKLHLENIKLKGFFPLHCWLKYHFKWIDLISDSIITTNQTEIQSWEDCYLFIEPKRVTQEDCPFWYTKSSNFKLKTRVKGTKLYTLLRSVRTTKLIPLQECLIYLAISFNVNVSILESLLFNCSYYPKNENLLKMNYLLVWNLY